MHSFSRSHQTGVLPREIKVLAPRQMPSRMDDNTTSEGAVCDTAKTQWGTDDDGAEIWTPDILYTFIFLNIYFDELYSQPQVHGFH